MVTPITILDNIITNNVTSSNTISDNSADVEILSLLFSSKENLKINPYILNTFKCFVNHKQEIRIDIRLLDKYCFNKELLGLLFSKIVSDTNTKYEDQNLIKKQVLKVFGNVTSLYIECHCYSFSLLAFLSIIDGTNINKVEILGSEWLPSIASSSSFSDICTEYQKLGFKVEYKYGWLSINTNII